MAGAAGGRRLRIVPAPCWAGPGARARGRKAVYSNYACTRLGWLAVLDLVACATPLFPAVQKHRNGGDWGDKEFSVDSSGSDDDGGSGDGVGRALPALRQRLQVPGVHRQRVGCGRVRPSLTCQACTDARDRASMLRACKGCPSASQHPQRAPPVQPFMQADHRLSLLGRMRLLGGALTVARQALQVGGGGACRARWVRRACGGCAGAGERGMPGARRAAASSSLPLCAPALRLHLGTATRTTRASPRSTRKR